MAVVGTRYLNNTIFFRICNKMPTILNLYNKHMRSAYIANDLPEITRVITILYPRARNVRHIDHGSENHIVIVDDCFVVRFPRSETVWKRAQLERFVLSNVNLPIAPKVLTHNVTPPYLIETFLPGQHMTEKEFRDLPIATQRSIGRQIAEFAFKFHAALDVREFKNECTKLKLQENIGGSYEDYLREMLHDYTFPTAAQDKIAKQYFGAWLTIPTSKLVVVHDDLHARNLLFQEENLSGVVDFGAAWVGTVEQELRQVYRLSDEALMAAITAYNSLAGTELNADVARIWAITQELATYARELHATHTTNQPFVRARDHLALWFPGVF